MPPSDEDDDDDDMDDDSAEDVYGVISCVNITERQVRVPMMPVTSFYKVARIWQDLLFSFKLATCLLTNLSLKLFLIRCRHYL